MSLFLVKSPVDMKYILVRQQTEREFFCHGDEVVALKKKTDLSSNIVKEMESGGLIGYPEYPFPWPLHSCVPLCFLNFQEFH